ncbi:MAG: MFS transporter [Microbacteriaceae bacterium]
MTAEATSAVRTDEPVRPVSFAWLAGFALAWFGFWLIVMLPGQFMVVKLASVIAPLEKVAIGSFLIAEMAIVIVVAVPIVGVLCDRTSPRFGRRKTWALGGFVVASVPFALIGSQTSWPAVAVLLGFVALGEATVLVSLSAMIADQVPQRQRGRASAAMGVPQVIALAAGMVLVTMLVTDIASSWFLIGVLALISPLPFLLSVKEPAPQPRAAAVNRPQLTLRSPAYRDYYWAMLSRVLINAGNLVGTTYLLFFIADVLGIEDADGALTVLILIYLGACAGASWLGGTLTDRFNNRRLFVAISAGLQAAAAAVLAFSPTWPSAIFAAVLLGIGYGVFLSVDQALITDLLPNPLTRARDLGLLNAAQHLPIAPLLGWLVLTFAGYSELYAIAAVIMALGGLVVYRIRSVH